MTEEKKNLILSKLEDTLDTFTWAKALIAAEDGHTFDDEYDLCRHIHDDLFNLKNGLTRRFMKE